MADDDDDYDDYEKLFLRPLDAVARGQKFVRIWKNSSKYERIFDRELLHRAVLGIAFHSHRSHRRRQPFWKNLLHF